MRFLSSACSDAHCAARYAPRVCTLVLFIHSLIIYLVHRKVIVSGVCVVAGSFISTRWTDYHYCTIWSKCFYIYMYVHKMFQHLNKARQQNTAQDPRQLKAALRWDQNPCSINWGTEAADLAEFSTHTNQGKKSTFMLWEGQDTYLCRYMYMYVYSVYEKCYQAWSWDLNKLECTYTCTCTLSRSEISQ